jgi:translation initiation factor 1
MSKKNKNDKYGFVYSTNPDFQFEEEQEKLQETLGTKEQKLKILEEVGKKLKNHCGTGGSAKDGEIIIQGDQRDKILQWLIKNGYEKSKKI